MRPDAERQVVSALVHAGFVDDGRLAHGRASALAERGWGDAAIAARLAAEGLPGSLVEAALTELEPEGVRAAGLTEGLTPRKAWTFLRRRGFDADTIESALGDLDETDGEGLG